ncbi:MAG TPA: 4Fe-4S binding protein [Geobacteraceae bacterium]|nr:4Fe-4S binding protein [Geobacteraceae bacterium]
MGEDEIAPLRNTPMITDPDRCSGCGRCISACPERLYAFENKNNRKYALNQSPEKCSLCGRCIKACPIGIIDS